MDQLTVVKIGGNVIDDAGALERFLKDFAALPGPKALVHGGGKEATRMSARLGIETKMIDGRRVTDRDTIDVVTMIYAGLVNKRIVAMLQALGCNAIGLTGADADVLTANRRPAKPVDYGYVGDIDPATLNADLLAAFAAQGITPVFCAIMHDGHGQLLNCNADSVASAVATGLAAKGMHVQLCYCFEKKGVLRDVDDPDSVIAEITAESFAQLRADGVISKGMLPKIENALASIGSGVDSVRIMHADDLLCGGGTTVRKFKLGSLK